MDPPKNLKMADANRILYIDLVGPLNRDQRKEVREEIFKSVKDGLKWYSENSRWSYTFYKKDNREYAELAAEIQRDQRQFYFHRDVRFQIFEPMPMDVVAVDQAAKNKKIPMELMAGMENLTLNSEECNLPLLRANRLLYINVADSEKYSDKELFVIRAALRRIIKNRGKIELWKSDQKSSPYLLYKVNDSETRQTLVDQVNAAINSMPDTLREKFKGRTVDFEFTIFVPMCRAEEPDVKKEELTDSDTETKEPTTSGAITNFADEIDKPEIKPKEELNDEEAQK